MQTDKEASHFYAAAYDHHFGHLRHRPIKLLEIGIGGYADPNAGGASLRMWEEYFPQAEITGLDLYAKTGVSGERIRVLKGDQSDPALLAEIGRLYGPFDLIVDDGSHMCAHVIASFRGLFPYLADEGIYAIEDLQTSYWPKTYGGSSGENREGTSMTFLHALTDGLNYAEFDIPGYQPTELDRSIRSIAFYHNLAFVQKGPNLEPSNFLPPHPRERAMFALPTAHRAATSRIGRVRQVVRRVVPQPVRASGIRLIRAITSRPRRPSGG
jgi:hypothetical protein